MSQQAEVKVERRGRPAGSTNKSKEVTLAVPSTMNVEVTTGESLHFPPEAFIPLATEQPELDDVLSDNGGLMPATNLVLVGGSGSGKTTITLDMIARLTMRGKNCVFVSGEMDRIGYYKMCLRLPHFKFVKVVFLKDYSENVKEAMEEILSTGYDVIAIDSIAEVLEMYKDSTPKATLTSAETWFINLQDRTKMGNNKLNKYTSFINIQQVTKSGAFVGSNRMKHMTDSMCHISYNEEDNSRTLHFSKNRDCGRLYKIAFTFHGENVYYTESREEIA